MQVVSVHIPLLAEEEEHGETRDHHFHRHHLGVMLAATSHLKEDFRILNLRI